MRNYFNVFRFEFLDLLKKKSTMVVTVILAILIFGVSLMPLVLQDTDSDETDDFLEYQQQFESAGYDLSSLDETNVNVLVQTLNIQQNQLYDTKEQLQTAIENEEHPIGFSVHSLLSFEAIYFNRGIVSYEGIFESVLRQIYRNSSYNELGIEPQAVEQIENTPIESETTILGRDSVGNYLITYVLSFVIYFVVLMYGNSIATSVAREKDSRTMELLITSTKPTQLILGKVSAVVSLSLLQVAIIVLSGFIGFTIAKDAYPEVVLMIFESTLTFDMVFVTLFFSVFGYLLYMFIYASLGSLVSRIEDLAASVMPITFVAMIGLFISMMSIQNVDGILNRLASIIPFTSFIAMPTRYLLTVVSTFDMVLAMTLLIVTTIMFAYLSIKIYRWGTLHYGNRVGFFKAIREVFKAH